MNANRISKTLTLAVGVLFGIAGCGGSGSGEPMGTLNFKLTDGPVNAEEVVIQFTGLELKPAGGPPEFFELTAESCDEFDSLKYCSIDLLTLQGTDYRTLFAEDVPAGEYQWVRLLVNAERDVDDSYVMLKNESESLMRCSLWMPSGSETGLKIVSGMTVTANGVSNYMLDFDARKSVTAPPGLPSPTEECIHNYILKPAIRIEDETETGSITGVVDRSVLYTMNGDNQEVLVDGCRDEAPMDGVVDNLDVYVFEDFDSLAVADDYDGVDDPIASAMVKSSNSGLSYDYEVGYLREGEYKLGLTCTADVDLKVGEGDAPDNFNCDTTLETCADTDPPFGFVADRQVNVTINTLSNGDFPEPVQNP